MAKAVITLLLLFSVVYCVDRSKFKSCEQSNFCKRNRGTTPNQSPYHLLMNTLKIYPTRLEAEIANSNNPVLLKLQIFALVDNTVRFKIEELNPLRPRYKAEEALVAQPEQQTLEVQSRDAQGLTFTFAKNKVLVTAKPFRVDLYSGEELVLSANARGLLNFEYTRTKPVPQEPEVVAHEGEDVKVEQQQAVDPVDEKGLWEEAFSSHTDSKPHGPTAVSMDFTFIGFEYVYGIPEHADNFALKETKSTDPYRLYNLDVFEYELWNPMSLYGSIPYMIGHNVDRTIGMLWFNPSETWIDISHGQQNMMLNIVDYVKGQTRVPQVDTHWISESGIIDVFVFLGPSAPELFKQYARVTGTTQLPQYATIGHHQCRWNYNDQDDVRNVDLGFEEHDIPNDFIWLDIEYTDGKKYFTWDKIKFPQPREMISNLTVRGRQMVLIIDPHIKRSAGYFVHEDATSKGYYVKTTDNKDYEGWSWPGSSSFLDFLNPVVRDYWASNFALDRFEGTTLNVLIWNDMNEPSVFSGPEVTMAKDAMHFGGWEHREVHNAYALFNVMGTNKGLLDRGNGKQRPFILTRGFFVGSQRYAAVWTGDNMASWDHLKATIPMLLSLSVAGMTFCGSDVGGFFGNPEPELIVRWYQAATFHTFLRAHAHIDTRRREPWLFDDETTGLIRAAIRRRYSYLPYMYTLFYENEVTGMPPMRPLWLEFPLDSRTFATQDSHMFGSALLIHPVVSQGHKHVDILLPGNNEVWYDVETYTRYGPADALKLAVTLAKVPIFQRGGTIVPKKERIRRSAILGLNDPYTLIVALDKEGSFANGTLYMDDGESFEYKQGNHLYSIITYTNNRLTYRISSGKFATVSWLERVVILGLNQKPSKIELTKQNGVNKVLEFISGDANGVVTIRKPAVNMGEAWSITLSF